MGEVENKKRAFQIQVGTLLAIALAISAMFLVDMNKLSAAYSDMSNIEFLSSSTQRLVRLAVTGQYDEMVSSYISDTSNSRLKPNQEDTLSVLKDVSIVLIANDVLLSWNNLEELFKEEEHNTNALILAGDNHFRGMNELSDAIGEYADAINGNIVLYQGALTVVFLVLVGVISRNAVLTHNELVQSKKLADSAQIDVATGLYNRSRCQELFKNNSNASSKKQPAILVLDLNDLKKTNDNLGHRVGDELIHAFAKVLQGAAIVHSFQPFIGRYGGDEFIIHYEDVASEEDIKIYLKELEFLTNQFNSEEDKFQLSYAVGYAFLGKDNDEKLTIRQLFDKADEAMYVNKIAGKRAKNPNYDEEAKEGIVR